MSNKGRPSTKLLKDQIDNLFKKLDTFLSNGSIGSVDVLGVDKQLLRQLLDSLMVQYKALDIFMISSSQIYKEKSLYYNELMTFYDKVNASFELSNHKKKPSWIKKPLKNDFISFFEDLFKNIIHYKEHGFFMAMSMHSKKSISEYEKIFEKYKHISKVKPTSREDYLKMVKILKLLKSVEEFIN